MLWRVVKIDGSYHCADISHINTQNSNEERIIAIGRGENLELPALRALNQPGSTRAEVALGPGGVRHVQRKSWFHACAALLKIGFPRLAARMSCTSSSFSSPE